MALYSLKKSSFILLIAGLVLAGCNQAPPTETTGAQTPAATTGEKTAEVTATSVPPSPPLSEDFQGEPQISFFPRVGQTRPAQEEELFPFWRTYLDHLQRTCGVVSMESDAGEQRFFSLRSLENVDSVGYFAPIAVEPYTSYKISARIKADLPDEAGGGIGIQEFNEFLWIGDQFDENLNRQHLLNSISAIPVSGKLDWTEMNFSFITGPQTRMLHLILYREGPDGKIPVLFDDLQIEAVEHQ